MKTILLTLALLPLSVAASDAPDRAKVIAVLPAVLELVLEPEKCYLWEDRLDQNGNWSGVKVEVECPVEVSE